MRRRRARRGFALVYVLLCATLVAAAAAQWQSSFQRYHPHALRGPERAAARALAAGAWERARLDLLAGREADRDEALGERRRVRVEVATLANGRQVTITARIRRAVAEQWVTHRLTLVVADDMTVRSRRAWRP